jgi:hypothetical protein
MSGTLTNSPAEVLRHLLIDLDHGVLPSEPGTGTGIGDWPIYVSNEPSAPDQVVTIYDTAGRYDGRGMRSGSKYEFHGVQLRIRGINHTDTFQKANDLTNALDQDIRFDDVTIDGVVYRVYDVSRTSGPLSLGNEGESNRVLFTINAVVALRQTT